ncbi:MAG: HK97 family phage prohead protease [Beijerinckiaceae bacterium]
MQRSSFAWEVKGIDETGYVEGLAAGYGNVDFGGDRILPGAFTKSLDGRGGVPMLLFHDQKRPVGKWSEFAESADGLIVKGRITVKTRDGGEAYELVKDGALAGLSIGYDATVKRMAGKVRELVEVMLHEVSLVSVGMNPKALISGVKEIEEARNRLAAGDRLSEREWEGLLKDAFGLSNAEAERVVRVHALRIGQGEPDKPVADPIASLWAAMSDAPIVDLTGD